MIPIILEKENIGNLKLLNTIKQSCYGWEIIIDENGDSVISGNEFLEKTKWLQDYIRKIGREISDENYNRYLSPHETKWVVLKFEVPFLKNNVYHVYNNF